MLATAPTGQEMSIETLANKIFEEQRIKSLALRTSGYGSRAEKLKKLRNWILANQDKICAAIYNDFKKSATEVGLTEIQPIISEINHTLTHLRGWMKPKKVDATLAMFGTTSSIMYEPKGTSLIIAPWNYPFSLCIGPLISALAAGCTAILKPSEMTPHTAALITQMTKALFEDNEVAVFEGGVEVSKHLLAMPFAHMFFTGSPNVGKIVMRAASEHLSSVTLELGGKSPAIVDETVNIKDAAEKIAWGKFVNNGQTCIAPDYLIVHQSIEAPFLEALKAALEKQYGGLGQLQDNSDYARIVNERHFQRLQSLLDDALENGADVMLGGQSDEADNFFPPTLISGMKAHTRVMHEEIFGPILPIVSYNNLSEVVDLINSKPKPLALYMFGKRKRNQRQILKETSAGGVCINEALLHFAHPGLPFGGVNNSGIGKSHGYHGFLAFSNEKPLLKQRVGFTLVKQMYPPYTPWARKLVNWTIKFFS